MGWGQELARSLVREQKATVVLVMLFFLLGIAAGIIVLWYLPQEEITSLSKYLDGLWKALSEDPPQRSVLVGETVWRNLKLALAFWFLGLTVVGLPLVVLLIFWRGFVLGFTTGFLIAHRSWLGIVVVLLGIIPHNLLYVPALLLGGIFSLAFSLQLIRGRPLATSALLHRILQYTGWMLVVALLLCLAGFLEGVWAPVLVRLVAASGAGIY